MRSLSLGRSCAALTWPRFFKTKCSNERCALTVVNGGELVKNLDDGFRAAHANVPWKDIAGFRDVAACKYQTLRMEDVRVTASDDFDALATMLGEIIEAEKRQHDPPLCAMPVRGARTGIVGAANVGGGGAAGVCRLSDADNRLDRPVEQSPTAPLRFAVLRVQGRAAEARCLASVGRAGGAPPCGCREARRRAGRGAEKRT